MASILQFTLAEGAPHHEGSKITGEGGKYKAAVTSTTLYVGNLSFVTTEFQLYELFSQCGQLKRIVMGLNRETQKPCGFCFVEYLGRSGVVRALRTLNNTLLDGRVIKVDIDKGFREGRQFGRGESGAQLQDEYSQEFEEGGGGRAMSRGRSHRFDRPQHDHPRSRRGDGRPDGGDRRAGRERRFDGPPRRFDRDRPARPAGYRSWGAAAGGGGSVGAAAVQPVGGAAAAATAPTATAAARSSYAPRDRDDDDDDDDVRRPAAAAVFRDPAQEVAAAVAGAAADSDDLFAGERRNRFRRA